MKASTQLEVKPDMRVRVTLDMTVDEMDEILRLTEPQTRWPMFAFRECLRESLALARRAYTSGEYDLMA